MKRRSFVLGAAALAAMAPLEIFAAGAGQETWTVRHRRLKVRLAGCTEWDAFEGTCTASQSMLRGFDHRSGQWAIAWRNGGNARLLDMPAVSRFENSVGSFFAGDGFEGKAVKVRFLWSHTDTCAPRWEQAFSADGGANWETNWTMDFTRTVRPVPNRAAVIVS